MDGIYKAFFLKKHIIKMKSLICWPCKKRHISKKINDVCVTEEILSTFRLDIALAVVTK
jgi:hypothetical protein